MCVNVYETYLYYSLKYYVNDVSVSGVVAKEFFEKSKLPVQELSKIWYFYHSDITVI